MQQADCHGRAHEGSVYAQFQWSVHRTTRPSERLKHQSGHCNLPIDGCYASAAGSTRPKADLDHIIAVTANRPWKAALRLGR